MVYSILLVLLISVQVSIQWTGCCSYSYKTQTLYTTSYRCDSGWTHNGDENCNIPICSPSCGSGKCIVKPYGVHGCDCPDGRTGKSCSEYDCSYHDPCYPGECQQGSRIICNCQLRFSGTSCLKMPDSWKATISNTHARMSFWKRGTQNPKEEYGLEIYSTETKTTKWTNMKRFNWLNVSATAMFNTETPARPSYVSDSGFGIVDARVNMKLLKLPAGELQCRGTIYGVEEGEHGQNQLYARTHGAAVTGKLTEEHVTCDDSITPVSPVQTAECTISKPNFGYLLENGDKLTLEFAATTGGFRKLINTKTGSVTGTEQYTGNTASTSVSYRFDFDKPHLTKTTDDAFHTNKDFTKDPISFQWSGWADDLSGMGSYTFEYFRLEPNGDGDLREVNQTRPLAHMVISDTVPIVYPLPITPQQPGMYSFLLGAVDKANNSAYMRRCVLYDPDSKVTADSTYKLFISSADQDSNGHQWINEASKPLVATWDNHFLNYAQEKGKYLNRVLSLSIYLVPGENIKKVVQENMDDHEGARTVNAVPNVRAIVRFQTAHAVNKSGGVTVTDNHDWKDTANLTTSLNFKANATSGSTLTFWVKAIDAMGNTKVDSTSVTFDFSNPTVGQIRLERNKPSKVPFSSKLQISSIDHESGIDHVQVKVSEISDGHLLNNSTLSVQSIEPKACTDQISDCYCPASLNVCYKRVNDVYISNCWLMVSKNSLKSAEVRLEVDVVNRAGLSVTFPSITITNLTSLNGTEAYFGPMNVKTEKISQSGVRVTWHHAPSCYPRTFIWLSYDESGKSIKIFKNAESYDLTGLDPGRMYTVKVMTDYGGIKSKPVAVAFKTLAAPGIGAGAIAGIAVGILLIITVLGVGLFLWKTGKAAAMIRRQQSRFGRSTQRGHRSQAPSAAVVNNVLTPKNSNLQKQVPAYKNNAYDVGDDIYLYGSMEFTSDQPWYIPKSKLTLVEDITVGRFARISKATYRGGRPREVVAKMLKDQQTEENHMQMMAKINFAATEVGEHPNVLGFVGAVLDNEVLGPVLVVEYCEKGQLDKWLCLQQDKVDMQVLEKIQSFAMEIARGMEHLVKKKIVHRKLAARNCLLTSGYTVKVAGFGPSRFDVNTEDEVAKADRIPVKWTAPECLKSLKAANEKSDMWSFGVTLWEIFSMGQSPYSNVRSRDLPTKIRNGHRLYRPEHAEDIHYDMMQTCWKEKPGQRPTFNMVVDQLESSFGLRPSSDAAYYYAK